MSDRQYELVYILPPDTTEQQVTELHQQLEADESGATPSDRPQQGGLQGFADRLPGRGHDDPIGFTPLASA